MFPQSQLIHVLILHNEDRWELCRTCRITYADPGGGDEISSASPGLHRILFDFSAALSMIQSLFCDVCASTPYPCWVSAPEASSFATQSGKIGALGLQRQGVWECSASWLSDQGRLTSRQVKEELRSLRTSPGALGTRAALQPLAEFAIAFFQLTDISSFCFSSRTGEKSRASPNPKCVFRGNTFSKKLLM